MNVKKSSVDGTSDLKKKSFKGRKLLMRKYKAGSQGFISSLASLQLLNKQGNEKLSQ